MKSFFIGNIEIKTPVIQGGMGVGISLSGLASAVANEGGVGVISCAGLGLLYPKGKGTYPEKCINGLKEEIRKARAKTKGIIGVNVMVALSNYADMVRTAIEEKIDVVFSGAGLPLDLVVGLRAHGDAHSDGEDLARADDGQRVVVQLEEGLHLALLTVHLGQSVLGVLDGDVVVRDLVAHQTADGAGEDEVGVPGAHANVVEAEHVRNSHITGDGGASAGEDVALLVQRHDHTRLDLGDLVEVGEGECVQRLLQVGLFVTQSAFRDLSSHVQADAAEDEGQHGEEDCTVGNEAAEEHGLLLFLSDNTV